MGLASALNNATTGLISSQAGLEIVARNVANVDSPGYTRKSRVPVASPSAGAGLGGDIIRRYADEYLTDQIRTENSLAGIREIKSEFLERSSELFGRPGQWGLAETYNDFIGAVQSLADAPHDRIARRLVVDNAQSLSSEIKVIGSGIQSLRQQAESQVDSAAETVNHHLQAVAQVNSTLGGVFKESIEYNELLDSRDFHLSELSKYIDINVITSQNGSARVFFSNGELLADSSAIEVQFDAKLAIDADDRYDSNPDNRRVGTISLGAGTSDALSGGLQIGGLIGGLIELRDKDLVELYDKVDAFAVGLVKNLTDTTVNASSFTTTTQKGINLDISSLNSGDAFHIEVALDDGSVETHTFLRVDSDESLPLDPAFVGEYPFSDSVTGINFSGGTASVATAVASQLGGDITGSVSGDSLVLSQPLTAGLTTASTLITGRAIYTTTDNQGSDNFPLFIDAATRTSFIDSIDGVRSELGFAERIAVNPALIADNSLIVKHDDTTGEGDPARPLAILNRLQNDLRVFSSKNPDNLEGTTLNGTVQDYISNMINEAAQSAETEKELYSGRQNIVNALNSRNESISGVNIDEELTNLITLQSSFAANARIVSVAKELMETLLAI